MEQKSITIPYHTYIIFTIGIFVYTFTLLLINGDLFNLYSSNDFPNEEYFSFWKNMTSEQRLFLTETYYKFYLDLSQKLLNIESSKKNQKIKMEIKFLNSTDLAYNIQYLNVPFILVSLIPESKSNFEKKLLICSHFDGHNLTDGGTAYDAAIHTVTMLGVIDTLTKKENLELNTQVDFLFDGAEEFGLVGAYQYIEYLKENNLVENYDYLNLESMGGSPPYGFVIKNNYGNYRIQKALAKTRGSILLAMSFIYDTGVVTSTTDHKVFNKQNWTGGVNVFLGKASVYHTKYDKIVKEDHLKIAGNQLLDFVLNYKTENDGYNGNSVGYGIAPICVVLPSLVFYIANPIIFVVGVVLIIIKERKNVKEFLLDLLFQFICFVIVLVIFVIIGLLTFLLNSNSASNGQAFIYLTAFMGLFLFLIFHRIFKIKKWRRFRLILDLILIMLFITTDLALPFLALTIISIVFYFFENKIIKYICSFFQNLILSLFFAFILQLVLQYTPRLSEIIGNIMVFVLFFIFSFHISASPLDLYEINPEEKIIPSIKGLFKKESEDENDSINHEEEKYKIMDELVDDDINNNDLKTSSKKTNKYLNTKNRSVYLLLFYLLYFLVILLILFLKPFPYSKSYTVNGVFLNIYKDIENSTMVFMPFGGGYNYAKKYIKESDYKSNFKEGEINDYLEVDSYKGKAFTVKSKENINVNNPQCIFTIPNIEEILNITYSNITNNKYEFNFNINISKDACIDLVYLYIYCNECVEEVNGKEKPKDYEGNYTLLIRVGKKEIIDNKLPNFIAETKMILNVNEFNYSLLLNTKKNSKDYLKFLDSFGEASVNFGQSKPADTVYKYEAKYKP